MSAALKKGDSHTPLLELGGRRPWSLLAEKSVDASGSLCAVKMS